MTTPILLTFAIILISMIFHELAHGLMAYRLGDETARDEGRLTLNPLKHLDPVLSIFLPLMLFLTGGPIFGGAKPVPVDTRNLKHSAWGMALVALAGPLTNFLLAFITFVIAAKFTGFTDLASSIIVINLGFGIFNLIPIPPLDGSRILYCIAPDPVRTLLEQLERFGIIFVMLLVIAFPSVVNTFMITTTTTILNFFTFLVQ